MLYIHAYQALYTFRGALLKIKMLKLYSTCQHSLLPDMLQQLNLQIILHQI